MKKFDLPFGSIEFDEDFIKYNELITEYRLLAFHTSNNFLLDCKKKYKSVDSIVENCEIEFEKILLPCFNSVVKRLIKEGFYDIDLDTFINEFYLENNHYSFRKNFSLITDKFYGLTLKKEVINEFREYKRKNSSQFLGGSFKYNRAFNFAGSLITSSKIKSELVDFYNSDEFDECIKSSAFTSLNNISQAFLDAYKSLKKKPYVNYSFDLKKAEQSKRLANNLMSGNIPNEKIEDVLIESLRLDPYNKTAYVYALVKYKDRDGRITKLADFASIEINRHKANLLNSIYDGEKNYKTELECVNLKNKLISYSKDLFFHEPLASMKIIESDLIAFDETERTIEGCLHASRSEAEEAKNEAENINTAMELVIKDDIHSIELFLNKFKNENLKFDYAKNINLELIKLRESLLEKEEERDKKSRSFNNVTFESVDLARKAEESYNEILEKRETINFENEKENKEWLSYLNNIQLNPEILSHLINESQTIASAFDKESRTVEGIVIADKNNVELAKKEFIKITTWLEKTDKDDESSVEKLKERISKENKTEVKFAFIEELDLTLENLDEEARTVDDTIYATRAEAVENRSLEKFNLALDYQKIKDRNWFFSLFLHTLGLFTSLIIIGMFSLIGLGVVFLAYVGWFMQRSKQKKAWKELSHNGKLVTHE